MTKGDTRGGGNATVSAVSALMEERRRYESWISALDQKRDATPDHVFTRVHADYTSRLEAVVAKLSTHADGLREEIGTLTSRLGDLRTEETKARDERAEAELRAHVGELTDEEWSKLSSESESRLSDLAKRAADIEQELERTRELLTDTERPTPAPPAPRVSASVTMPAPEPEPLPSAPASDAGEAAISVAPPVEPAPVAAPAPGPEVLPSSPPPEWRASLPLTGAPAAPEAAPVAAAPAPRQSVPLTPTRAAAVFDELSFLRSVVDAPAGTPEPGPREEADEASKRDTFARQSRESAIQHSGDQPLILRSSGEELSRADPIAMQRTPGSALDPVKDPAVEGAKTLRCAECGALNYPTEWYCERCGAELASL